MMLPIIWMLSAASWQREVSGNYEWMETHTICKYNNSNLITENGGMREWLKRAVLKTVVPERVPGVRIPLPPPLIRQAGNNLAVLGYCNRLFVLHVWRNKVENNWA